MPKQKTATKDASTNYVQCTKVGSDISRIATTKKSKYNICIYRPYIKSTTKKDVNKIIMECNTPGIAVFSHYSAELLTVD
jgi:hypothetical protein